MTRQWNIVNDYSNTNYDVINKISYKTEILNSNLCGYNYAYILIRGDIITTAHNNLTSLAFKNVHDLLNVSQKLMGHQ